MTGIFRSDEDEAEETLRRVDVVGEEYPGQYDSERKTLRDAGRDKEDIPAWREPHRGM